MTHLPGRKSGDSFNTIRHLPLQVPTRVVVAGFEDPGNGQLVGLVGWVTHKQEAAILLPVVACENDFVSLYFALDGAGLVIVDTGHGSLDRIVILLEFERERPAIGVHDPGAVKISGARQCAGKQHNCHRHGKSQTE